jgi:hypothetical protein
MNEFSWLSFADVGKRLGEMWHSLSEDEKEEYRRRSRAIADQKLREWHERMKMFPPHQQASNLVAQVSSQVIQPEYVWPLVFIKLISAIQKLVEINKSSELYVL